MPEDNLKPIEEVDEETPSEGATPEGSEDEGEVRDEEYVLPDDESIPEKFRGKSPTDVLKSYTELEKMITKKAETLATEMLQQRGVTLSDQQKKDVKEVTDDMDLDKIDFTKMSPSDFARWIMGEVDKRAEAKARHIITQTSGVQESVRTEVRDAQEKHPHLKDNAEYRDAVLALIENASARGETMSLEDACQKVDKLVGITQPVEKVGVEEKKPNLVKRTGVEKTKPVDSGENMTEEERVKQGMLGAGGGKSSLGGLGI